MQQQQEQHGISQNAITEASEEGFRKNRVTSEALYSEQQVKSQSSCCACE